MYRFPPVVDLPNYERDAIAANHTDSVQLKAGCNVSKHTQTMNYLDEPVEGFGHQLHCNFVDLMS